MTWLTLLVWFPAVAQGAPIADFVIEGEVLKPEITVYITRENLNKSFNLVLEESFLQRVVESVEKPPLK